MKKMVCQECDQTFENHRTKKFCSHKCQDINRRLRNFGTRQCEQCGKDYIPKRETSRFCSEWCCLEYSRVTILNRRAVGTLTEVCPVCGEEFKAVSHHKDQKLKYCSKECSYVGNTKELECIVCKMNYLRTEGCSDEYCSRGCRRIDYTKTCVVCGQEFEAAQRSQDICPNDKCKRSAWKIYYINSDKHQNKTTEGICMECGRHFVNEYGEKRSLFCSDNCKDKAYKKTEAYKANRKRSNRRRRARVRGVESISYNDVEIFIRDNWTCQICGQPVDKDLKFPHLMSASIDHTIPLSKKGADVPNNVQLAHFICNSYKRDQVGVVL